MASIAVAPCPNYGREGARLEKGYKMVVAANDIALGIEGFSDALETLHAGRVPARDRKWPATRVAFWPVALTSCYFAVAKGNAFFGRIS
jgi:hypothetical protein